MRKMTCWVGAALLGLFAAWPVSAGTMKLSGPDAYQQTRKWDEAPPGVNGVTTLNPNKSQGNKYGVTPLVSNDGPGGIDANAWGNALADFNQNQAKGMWTLKFQGTALDGTLNIDQYQAARKVVNGKIGYGAILAVTFTLSQQGLKDLQNAGFGFNDLHFLQKVYTNKPISNANTSPGPGNFTPENYIDPRPGDDIKQGDKEQLPFYYTLAEEPAQKNATKLTYKFSDFSSRGFEAGTFWTADLMLAAWKDNRNADGFVMDRTVDVYDGVRWGWQMTAVPTPEPSGIVLFTLGAFLIVPVVVRKRKQPALAA